MAIRELEVKATADTTDLQRGMQEAQEAIGGVEKESGSAQRGVDKSSKGMSVSIGKVATAAKLAGAAAIAAGAAYAVHLVKSGMQAADEQAKLARQLGVTTEQLATLTRAADLNGISSTELTRNMERLNRTLGEASSDGGAASEAFEKIGLSAAALIDMSPDEQMRMLGKALEGVDSQAERAAIASDIFGRSGQRMLLLFENADDTFDRAAREVDTFGLALDDVDSAAIEAANDNVGTLKAALGGLGQQMAATVAPAIRDTTSAMIEYVAQMSSAAQSVMDFLRARARLGTDEEQDTDRMTVLLGERERAEHRVRKAQMTRNPVIEQNAQAEVDALTRQIRAMEQRASVQNRIDQQTSAAEKRRLEAEQEQLRIEEEAAKRQAENLKAIADAYGQTREGQIENTKAALEYFRAFEIQGPRTIAVISDLEDQLAQLTDNGLTARVETMRDSMRTETEIAEAEYAERTRLLQEARENEILSDTELAEMKEQVLRDHMVRMADIELEGVRARDAAKQRAHEAELKRIQEEARERTRMVTSVAQHSVSAFSDIAQAAAQSSEEQLLARQLGGSAEALVNTSVGITRALSAGNWIEAGAIAAAGAAQIARIWAQSYQGGAKSAGGGAPSRPTAETAAQPERQDRRLIVQGVDANTLFTGESVRGLMDEIAEAQKDGYQVVI
jgi:hypothetical protein